MIAFSRAGDNGSGDGETVIEERPAIATDMPKPTSVPISENSPILSTEDNSIGSSDNIDSSYEEDSSDEEDDQMLRLRGMAEYESSEEDSSEEYDSSSEEEDDQLSSSDAEDLGDEWYDAK